MGFSGGTSHGGVALGLLKREKHIVCAGSLKWCKLKLVELNMVPVIVVLL